MTKVRYKIRKEQLERVVENFVMESAMIEKNAAKKHKMSMGAEQADDMGEGMEKAKEVKNHKMKQAPEVKKNIKESVGDVESIISELPSSLVNRLKAELEGVSKEEIVDAVEDAQDDVPMEEDMGGKTGVGLLGAALIKLGISATLKERFVNSLGDSMRTVDLSTGDIIAIIAGIAGIGLITRAAYKGSKLASKDELLKRKVNLQRTIKKYGPNSAIGKKAQEELNRL